VEFSTLAQGESMLKIAMASLFIKNKKYLTKLHLDTNKLNITFKDDFDNFKNGVTSSDNLNSDY
jgi:hypothetical protein